MNSSYNILFSAAGRRVSLLRHFRKTLDALGLQGKIIAADASSNAPASFIADKHVHVPKVNDPNYINAMINCCRENAVRLLFPLIDTDLSLLSIHRRDFEAIGTRVVVSGPQTNDICFNKIETWRFFLENNIDTPEVLELSQLNEISDNVFPLLIKPFDGSCGIGVTKVNNRAELNFFSNFIKNAMIQEFVNGKEFTIDVLVGFDGKIGCIIPRKRIEIRAGEVSKGITVKSQEIMTAARRVVEALPDPLGCITVQCFQLNDGRIKFIEINPRFGGGFPLSLHATADFPRWLIEQDIGNTPTQYREDWIDDLAMLRYDDEIIVKGSDIR